MQLSHKNSVLSARFDDTNLVSAAGRAPAMALAVKTGLGDLTNKHLHLPGYFGANAGLKVTALVAGMVAGADSIDDMALLRHGGMKKLFTGAYAPSTLGSFLRAFTVRSRPPARCGRVAVAREPRRHRADRGRYR